MIAERRMSLRHKVHSPLFASFDGVTGGMILDLSEQGLSMQTAVPLHPDRRVDLRIELPGQTIPLETTGYVAWADAIGRAGLRFSQLPEEARQRLDEWLKLNDATPSRTAPKLALSRSPWLATGIHSSGGNGAPEPLSISLEADTDTDSPQSVPQSPHSNTTQYEFSSLGSDLDAALGIISERARSLIRGDGAAIALMDKGPMDEGPVERGLMTCRASVGSGAPPLGTPVDADAGFSGECIRTGMGLRCDDIENDSRVDAETCRQLGIRSILAAPIRYERQTVGLMEVFSPQCFAFDEGDLAVLERLAQTVLLTLSQAAVLTRARP